MKSNKYTVYPSTVCLSDTPVLSPAVLGGIEKIARRYTLPPKCPITRDDLIQEGYLAVLEYHHGVPSSSSITGELHSPSLGQPSPSPSGEGDRGGEARKAYSIARKAMQTAISRYVSPVTRSLDTPISLSPSGERDQGREATLLDKLASDIAIDLSCDSSIREERLRLLQADCIRRSEVLTPREHLILTRLYGLDGTPPIPAEDLARHMGLTYNNIRKIKQRILHKLHDFLSQNPKSSVYI